MLKFSTFPAGLRQWCFLKVSEPEVHRCGDFAFSIAGEVKRVLFCDGMRAILKKDRIKNVE